MPYILEAENLSYKDFLHYPAIKIKKQQITFITGPSGSGKSTLLALFNGTLPPSGGLARYGGQDIQALDTIWLRRQVALAGQAVMLFDGTVRENFARFYQYRSEAPPPDAEIQRCLSLCSGDFSLEADCSSMSGGERQRVYLAVFLSTGAKVLLLDEPTSALDTATASQLFLNLRGLCRAGGITVVAVSHNEGLARQHGDDILTICRGGGRDE